MAITLQEIQNYIVDNKSLVLATVDEAGNPQLRHLGGYNLDGRDIVFLTTAGTAKTQEIAKHPQVAVLFQHEGQQAPKNITIYGEAKKLDGQEAVDAAALISKRRPQIQYNPSVNETYKVYTKTVKILDFESEEKRLVLDAENL